MTAAVEALVDRLGRTGFAAATSLVWALPMAAWAGSVDLSPIDRTAFPWVALGIGALMLAAWIAILTRLRAIPVADRPRRFDLAQMSAPERRWALICFAFACGAIAWLNAAATVDWQPLMASVAAGGTKATLLAATLGVFPVGMLAGVALSWRRWSGAFARRG
jgi:hypothetical protein